MREDDGLSIREYLEFLSGGTWRKTFFLEWPPDVFALAASLLERTGAYTSVVEAWPEGRQRAATWIQHARKVGKTWRDKFGRGGAPTDVIERWRVLQKAKDKKVAGINEEPTLRRALIELVAFCDEASKGVGLPGEKSGAVVEEARRRLAIGQTTASLCRFIDPSKLQVLPKLHTPQTGMSLRSLTHNLALCRPKGLRPRWIEAPGLVPLDGHRFTLLIVPWPPKIDARQFTAVPREKNQLKTMGTEFGFFEYVPPRAPDVEKAVHDALCRATKRGKRVDGVVLPELAVGASDYERLKKAVLEHGSLLICGVMERGPAGAKPRNRLAFDALVGVTALSEPQAKHHRWKLNRSQIEQYGLQRRLAKKVQWWEHSSIEERSLCFFVLNASLTVAVLICEDLARQEPAAEVVRAVGPNLVIALLLDGPQLPARWPARYATVLAEDPGSTVLTLTCKGMVDRCEPPKGAPRSRVVALCKEGADSKFTKLTCPKGKTGILLTFRIEHREEWTADGRGDGRISSYPILEDWESL